MKKHSTHWFVIKNEAILLLTHNNALPSCEEIVSLEASFLRDFKLGQVNNIEYYCGEMDPNCPIPKGFSAFSLRTVLSSIDLEQYSICVKAYSIINWDKNHQHCSRCAKPTEKQPKEYERKCIHCNLSFYPRISPSIIVLIKKGDQLLMARGPHFPPGVYGLIAGFVEVGESLEEAIHREVREEVGLEIKNLSYFGSQPWPFPDSLMLAFLADYASGEIQIDKNEIEEANWYRYDNLPGRPSSTVSIASKLVEGFVNSFDQN
jgi:NAD+ diphosphatase